MDAISCRLGPAGGMFAVTKAEVEGVLGSAKVDTATFVGASVLADEIPLGSTF